MSALARSDSPGIARPDGWELGWDPVEPDFFAGDPLDVARRMLGLVVARRGDDGVIRAGRIVEVEAYLGMDDPASHAFRGPTPRTQVMFGPPGHLYVYRSYGIHWCANAVCSPDGTAGAVLLRALEPCAGVDQMWEARPKAKRETDLASGPGKLCAALGITGADNGESLVSGATFAVINDGARRPSDAQLAIGPRVGISNAVDKPWRFWLLGNRHVSSPRNPQVSTPISRNLS